MKATTISLERVDFEPGKSFKLFSPSFRNTYMWHYHPEVELVYVQADAGIRHVGSHISTYTQSDLVLIGGNMPHLNFDYRLRTDYEQIVIQLKQDFLGTAFDNTAEFKLIERLFARAEYGVAFYGETKAEAAERLKALAGLPPFEQLITLMGIFHFLAQSSEYDMLNNDLSSKNFILKDKVRMGAVYEYVDKEYAGKPDVNFIAEKVNLTTPAFCRYFKKQNNMTFTEFVNQYRMERAKNLLMQNKTVSETCYAVGFESLSYFNKLFKQLTGHNPSEFRWNR